MIRALAAALLACFLPACASGAKSAADPDEGFVPIFDGKTLQGWKSSEETPGCFKVEQGAIVAKGGRAHLFYDGTVAQHNFKNFHLKLDVMTTPGSNGGLYFHTAFQDKGWPDKGYEIQVNGSHKDPKRGASLYGIVNLPDPPAPDGVWYTQEIIVQGNRIRSVVNGKTVVDYTQPQDGEPNRPKAMTGRVLSSGTFAIQAHDPDSTTRYRNIRVKPLP
jgi:hypothetical protein